ncbi:hypothetical protein DFS34DRAFT_321293 [Phlyctochytrium arcticum]|nr:hypothetical protein DFS34DRAFT_321293 [Phlyctochytrium arcticum]
MKIDQAMLMNMSDTELQGWLVSWLTKRREKERKLQQNIWKSKLLDDKTFLRMFRMTRPDFLWLVDQLRETLDEYQSSVDWPEPLSAETQVSVSLYYLGHGCSFTKLNTLFGLIPTVGTPTVLDFVEAVRVVFHKVVGMPAHTDLAAWDEISQRFLKKGGIPGVVGVIDAMHVPFFQPRPGFIWRNRRGWSSIIVQTVVDADGNFQDVRIIPMPNCESNAPPLTSTSQGFMAPRTTSGSSANPQ